MGHAKRFSLSAHILVVSGHIDEVVSLQEVNVLFNVIQIRLQFLFVPAEKNQSKHL